jgi:hypothetical protein
MMDRILALFAFAIFAIFLGILAVEVWQYDLKAVILLTVVLVAYDFWTSARKSGN